MTELERKFKINERNCCSCEYWTTGMRKPDLNGNFVTANPKCKGICFGKRKPQEKAAQDKMPCWVEWLVLKKKDESITAQEVQDLIDNIKNQKTSDDF